MLQYKIRFQGSLLAFKFTPPLSMLNRVKPFSCCLENFASAKPFSNNWPDLPSFLNKYGNIIRRLNYADIKTH